LKLGNDITLDEVVDEIRSYDSARDPAFIPWFKVTQFFLYFNLDELILFLV